MTDKPFKIAFLIYPGMTQLDFTGPAEVLARMPDTEIVLLWKTLDPVVSDNSITFLPHKTIYEDTRYNMICVPGGYACTDLMVDADILNWLKVQAETAEYITSVCTGSLVLAAAGLLDGYKAGCHWAWADYLTPYGATPVKERVVIDRNRITAGGVTAGGVTAGIDFGFRIVEQRFGRDIAEAFQLGIEYDPEPMSGGVPATARPEIIDMVQAGMASRLGDRAAHMEEAAQLYRQRQQS